MVAMWPLVAYTKYFNWNCVEVALAYKKLLFSGTLKVCLYLLLYYYTVSALKVCLYLPLYYYTVNTDYINYSAWFLDTCESMKF